MFGGCDAGALIGSQKLLLLLFWLVVVVVVVAAWLLLLCVLVLLVYCIISIICLLLLEVLLSGSALYDICWSSVQTLFVKGPSAQWQPDGLTIHTKKGCLGAGFLGLYYIYIYIHTYMYIYIYIYVLCTYIYIYTCTEHRTFLLLACCKLRIAGREDNRDEQQSVAPKRVSKNRYHEKLTESWRFWWI